MLTLEQISALMTEMEIARQELKKAENDWLDFSPVRLGFHVSQELFGKTFQKRETLRELMIAAQDKYKSLRQKVDEVCVSYVSYLIQHPKESS